MDRCKLCQQPAPPAELNCYSGRCEACFCNGCPAGVGLKKPMAVRTLVLDGGRMAPGQWRRVKHG